MLLLLGAIMVPAEVQRLVTEQFTGLMGAGVGEEITTILEHAERPDTGKGLGAARHRRPAVRRRRRVLGAAVRTESRLGSAAGPRTRWVKQFVTKRLTSFGLVLTLAFLLLVAHVVSTVLSTLGGMLERLLPDALSGAFLWVLHVVVSLAAVGALFALMLKYLPDAQIAWRDALASGFATALPLHRRQVRDRVVPRPKRSGQRLRRRRNADGTPRVSGLYGQEGGAPPDNH
jgi:membrane protein